MKNCIPIGQPRRILANPDHPDYYKYVLENGTTDPKTFRSFYNQPDLTEFSHSLLRHAPYSFTHPMKKTEEVFKFDTRTGIAYMDITDRDDILALKGLRPTIEEEYENLIKIKDEEDFQNIIREKTIEINRRFENIDIPNKEEIKSKILQEFIVDNFKGELNRGNRDLVSRVRSMTSGDINKSKELLAQLTRRQVIETEQAQRMRMPEGEFEMPPQLSPFSFSEIPAPTRPDGTVLRFETERDRRRDLRTGQPTTIAQDTTLEASYGLDEPLFRENREELNLKQQRILGKYGKMPKRPRLKLTKKEFKIKKPEIIEGGAEETKGEVVVGQAGMGAGGVMPTVKQVRGQQVKPVFSEVFFNLKRGEKPPQALQQIKLAGQRAGFNKVEDYLSQGRRNKLKPQEVSALQQLNIKIPQRLIPTKPQAPKKGRK